MSHELFFTVLSEETGLDIPDEKSLLMSFAALREKQSKYERIAEAYENVMNEGYGIVMPTMEELKLEEPQIIKQSGKYGVKLKASAPSVHMMKIDTYAQVTPIVGSEQQANDLVNYIKESSQTEEGVWSTNIFGKTIEELVTDGMKNKIAMINDESQQKLQDTMQKIVNDSNGGMVCIII